MDYSFESNNIHEFRKQIVLLKDNFEGGYFDKLILDLGVRDCEHCFRFLSNQTNNHYKLFYSFNIPSFHKDFFEKFLDNYMSLLELLEKHSIAYKYDNNNNLKAERIYSLENDIELMFFKNVYFNHFDIKNLSDDVKKTLDKYKDYDSYYKNLLNTYTTTIKKTFNKGLFLNVI